VSRALTTRFLLLLLSASSAQAAIQITFVGGRTIVAEALEIRDGRATLTLPGGGTMTLEAKRIHSTEALVDPPRPAEPAAPPADVVVPASMPENRDPEPVPSSPARIPATASTIVDYASLIQGAAQRYTVDAELLRCVLEVESGFDAAAVSPKGAMGVAQLMPGTARDLGVKNPFDPAEAVDGAARHLRDLLARSGGRFVPALAAYNAGEGTVHRYGGLPPYRETIAYIERILTLYGSH